MKKISLILVFITVATFGFTQRWQHVYGYPGTDENCAQFIEFYDKGYFLNSSYDENMNWLIKTDINGNILWEKFLSWENSYIASGDPLQDSSGNCVLAGYVWINNEENWPMINKLNPCGDPVFCRVFKDENFDYASVNDAILLENNDILLLVLC